MKPALLMSLLVLLVGCASAPKPLQGEFAAVLPEQASGTQRAGDRVRWGGSIVRVEPAADRTCFEILGRDLGDAARPRLSGDSSVGRFLACRSGFYDPAIFAPDREITVTGRIDGFETRRIGEFDYRYPRIAAEVIYLWPERSLADRRRLDPYWPHHPGYWWGGWRSPWWW